MAPPTTLAPRRSTWLDTLTLVFAALASLPGLVRAGDPGPATLARIEDFAPPEEFVVAGGIKTHYVKAGQTGPVIVLIHGFGSSTYTWRHNIAPLAARGHRVYAIDIKGFGLTEKPKDGTYHLAAFTQHLLDFLDVMRIERPILVGNSMGGAIIARLALAHPERVAGVVLVDPAPPEFRARNPNAPLAAILPEKVDSTKPVMAAPPAALIDLRSRLGAAMAKTLVTREAVERGLRGAYHDQTLVTPEAVEIYYRPMRIEGTAEALTSLGGSPLGPATTLPPLKSLSVPALIIWGRHDKVIPIAMADYFGRELPSARRLVLESSGHMPHEEEAGAFNAAVADFADQTLPPAK